MPAKELNQSHEATIRERLAQHFQKHYDKLGDEKRGVLRRGLLMVVFGIIFMVAATLIIFKDPHEDLLLSFLVVFLEPAAWFLLWEGMDQILFAAREVNSELSFYRKMAGNHHHIHFKSY